MASYVSITKTEGTARPVAAGSSKALIIGPCSSGVKENTIYTFSSAKTVNDTIGYGNAALAAQLYLSKAPAGFGSVDVIVSSGSIAPVSSSITTASPAITAGGTAYASYDLRVIITVAGTAVTAKFKYSLDGGANYSDDITCNTTYAIPNTGMTIMFGAGSHAVDNEFRTIIQGPGMNATNLSTAAATIATVNNSYTNILVADDQYAPVSCSALFSTLDSTLTTLGNTQYKFTQAVMNVGGETYAYNRTIPGTAGINSYSQVLTNISASATSTGNFIACVAERVNIAIPVPQVAYANPRLPYAFYFGARAHGVGSDISRNPAQDSFSDISNPSYDEFKNGFVYTAEKVIAPRTYPSETGISMDEAHLKTAANSTFDIWPKARVVSRAAEVLKTALRPFLHTRIRTLTDGTGAIDPVDKAGIETALEKALRAALITPVNGQGFDGHITAFRVNVSDSNNVLLTGNLDVTLEVVPFAYPSSVSAVISLTDTIAVTPA
jgi:hypothetical protein